MKKLIRSHTFTIHEVPYICDVLISGYASSGRPCILLVDPRESTNGWQETIAVATVNPSPGYLQGHSQECVPFKTWAENEGLLEQLVAIKDEEGLPYLLPVRTSDNTAQLAITMGFCKAPVYALRGRALTLYLEALSEFTALGVRT